MQASPPFFRRNFVLGIATGAFMNIAMAFIDPFTVLPVFITKLGGSAGVVGLVSALHGVGWFLPQIFASRVVETRRYVLPMYIGAGIVRLLALTALVVVVFRLGAGEPRHLLFAFIALFLLTHLAGGFSAVPLLEVLSKTIPVNQRGRFFGNRRLFGGFVAIIAGAVVSIVLDSDEGRLPFEGPFLEWLTWATGKLGMLGHAFPSDFAILFLLSLICMALGTVLFMFAGEPPSPSRGHSTSLLAHARAGFKLLLQDRHYRRFYWVRICWQFTAMAFPFYAGFAFTRFEFSESTVGLFLSVWVAGGVFSNYLWGKLLDRSGNRIVLLITAMLSALPPLIVLLLDGSSAPASGALALALVSVPFAINGFIRSGRIISNITYLLELGPEDKRPLYVGFMNSFSFPFMLSPVLGGLMIEVFNMKALFATALVFAVANTALSFGLREPRDAKADEAA